MTTPHGYPEPKGPLTLSPSKYARGGVPAMTTHHGSPRPEGPLTLSQMEHPPVEDPLRRKPVEV